MDIGTQRLRLKYTHLHPDEQYGTLAVNTLRRFPIYILVPDGILTPKIILRSDHLSEMNHPIFSALERSCDV